MTNPCYPKPTAEMIEAAKNVVACRAILETIRPKIDAIHDEVLAEFQPKDENGNSIRWFDLYLLGEEGYTPILEAADQRIRAAGFTAPEGCCPLLVAENSLRKASWAMNELALTLMPEDKRIDLDSIWDMNVLKKLTDLNLKYIISHT